MLAGKQGIPAVFGKSVDQCASARKLVFIYSNYKRGSHDRRIVLWKQINLLRFFVFPLTILFPKLTPINFGKYKYMKSIQITDEMLVKAHEWEAIVTRGMKAGGNYTGLEIKNRFFYGYLGELALFSFLKTAGKKCEYNVELTGKSGRQDFTFHFPIGARSIDTKTTSKPTYPYFLLAKSQPHPYDYYIGIRLGDTVAQICGVCSLSDCYEPRVFGGGILDYWLPFEKMRPIEPFIDKMEAGPATIYLTK